MNQILNTNYKNEKMKRFFKIQFGISIIFIIWGIIYIIKTIREKERENNLSNIISINAKLNSIFSNNTYLDQDNIYLGRIICEKIDLDYYVYNEYSEENLKILPCKLYGEKIGEDGNICIIGHNYFDDRFFSNLNQLELGDTIILKDLEENNYEYEVYKKYEVDESNINDVIKQQSDIELTLCTCTYNKEKRFIIRAKI